MNLIVKWSGKEYGIAIDDNMTVSSFKDAIESQTGVKPSRQKIMNLKHMGKSRFIEIKLYHIVNVPSNFCVGARRI